MDPYIKEQIQKEYEKVTDFSDKDWAKKIARKFNVTENDVLNNIDL